MKVLVACEESQAVCKAFREKGHEAFSCDIIECSGGHPEWHIQGDVLPLLNGDCEFVSADGQAHKIKGKWDMIFAFPPCTYLCNTGTPYLNVKKYGAKAIERAKKREEAFEFFMQFANADCEKIVIENPVGLPCSRYRKPNQIINPWQFRDANEQAYAKKTCLWLKGVPPLKPFYTEKPENCKSYAFHTMYDENGKTISWSSELSKKLRSKTHPGIARAMAEQWGQSNMTVLDLFCGTKSISKAFEARGHTVFTVDWDKQFKPDLAADIGTLTAQDIINLCGGVPNVIWASPDCTTYSVAAISKHRRKEVNGNLTPITDYAKRCDEINKHLIELIQELKPKYWFIENPRGGFRKMDFMKTLPRYTVTYCKYGEKRMKPTDIWTNHPQPDFIPPCKNGDACHEAAPRGAQTGTQSLKNRIEKARIPVLLCEHIVDICEK